MWASLRLYTTVTGASFRSHYVSDKSAESYDAALAKFASPLRRKRKRHGNRATPHPPALFVLRIFCNWDFVQFIPPDRASSGGMAKNSNCRLCK